MDLHFWSSIWFLYLKHVCSEKNRLGKVSPWLESQQGNGPYLINVGRPIISSRAIRHLLNEFVSSAESHLNALSGITVSVESFAPLSPLRLAVQSRHGNVLLCGGSTDSKPMPLADHATPRYFVNETFFTAWFRFGYFICDRVPYTVNLKISMFYLKCALFFVC